jgi:hypothetical protein
VGRGTKLDGFRCLAHRGPHRVALQSRHERPLSRYFPEIVAALGQLDVDVVLDGELVLWRAHRCTHTDVHGVPHRRTLTAMPERLNISLPPHIASRVRQCGARYRGGASEYVARLVQQDELREAARPLARWYGERPTFPEDALAETEAALAEES